MQSLEEQSADHMRKYKTIKTELARVQKGALTCNSSILTSSQRRRSSGRSCSSLRCALLK